MLVGYLSVVLLAVASAGSTDADPGTPVEVHLDGPDGCSSASAFLTSLRSRTDRVRQAEPDEPHTTLQVRLSREHSRVFGELRLIDDHGDTSTRRVQGASCDDVVQALSLTAALALDPTALLSAPSAASPRTGKASDEAPAMPATPPVPPAAPQPAQTVPTVVTPVAAPPPGPMPATELGASIRGLTLLSGSFSPGFAIEARRTLRRPSALRPMLSLSLAYVRNDVLQSPAQAQAALLAATASACPLRLVVGSLAIAPCAVVLGGWLSVSGRQVTHVGTANRPWLAAGITARAGILLSRRLSLEIEGGIAAIVLKRRFFATLPSNVVAETPAVSPLVGVGLFYGL